MSRKIKIKPSEKYFYNNAPILIIKIEPFENSETLYNKPDIERKQIEVLDKESDEWWKVEYESITGYMKTEN